MNKFIQYRIATAQDSWGERKWRFVLKKYMRVTFKRSGRVGWRWMGFVRTEHEGKRFDSRLEALRFARALREERFPSAEKTLAT